jgi:hypothetical protein
MKGCNEANGLEDSDAVWACLSYYSHIHHHTKMLPGPPTKQEIWGVARRTTDIIIEAKITTNVYVFGSAASSLWADIGRVPNVRRATQPSICSFFDRRGSYSKHRTSILSSQKWLDFWSN